MELQHEEESLMKRRPIYPIHPGEILVPSNRIYQLLAGKRAMSADTALRLEQWLGVSAAFWMNLQKRMSWAVYPRRLSQG